MAEEKGIETSSKIRSWLVAFIVASALAVALCWTIFGIWSYLYPERINYTFKTAKNYTNILSVSGKEGMYFISLPTQQIQLTESNLPIHTLEIQVAFATKNQTQETDIAAKLPLIQDMFITYLRTTTVEELKESGRLFYLKEALLEQVNALMYPAQIQDILFQKIIIREGI